VPVLAYVHHLKLPVSDLTRSAEWYQSFYRLPVAAEFVEQGTLMATRWRIPRAGRIWAAAGPGPRGGRGFDYSIGVPTGRRWTRWRPG
jgi:hypothetical protein